MAERFVYHAVRSIDERQSLLKGIDKLKFKHNSRFGYAFYLSEVRGTAIAECLYHNQDQNVYDVVRYPFNPDSENILDLTDASIAKKWGYCGGNNYAVAQSIAKLAQHSGFNVIRYSSERGQGANLAVFDNFNKLLIPEEEI
ncbi:MAG TPA: RES family NAD+ phosphorylase [Gammaproteobacteria bacterium]|nr:RES family NAD+ phosphorylase [Gammaproteobacteria bacterium]